MHQAMIFPNESQWKYFFFCRDQQISTDQPSLRGTVRPDYLSHYEVGPSDFLQGHNVDAIFAEKVPKVMDKVPIVALASTRDL